jgi:outer membrane receptor protein involved in Fe transport
MFHIPRQPLEGALAAWALQSRLSMGRSASTACRNTPVALDGRFQPLNALKRLLNDSGCAFRVVDADTVAIVPAPGPKPPRRAQTVDQATPVGEVVVTAARRRELIDRSPSDVTRIDAALLDQSRTASLEDLTPFIAGMTVTNLGLGRDKIILRGLSDGVFTGRTQSTVSVYLDDVPLSYNAPNPDLRLVDVEDVEVLRGPQGALYGAGSIGGVIHIITKKADLTAYSASLEASGAETEGGAPSSVFQGMVNLPLLLGRLALRVTGYREEDGGYLDDVDLGKRNVNQSFRSGQRGQLRLALTPGWTVTLSELTQSINANDTQYATGDVGPLQRDVDVQEPHDNDFSETALVVAGGGATWRLKSTTAYVRHQLDSQYDATDAAASFPTLEAGPAAFNEADDKDLFSQEITLASSGPSRLQWLTGLYALSDKELSLSTLSSVAVLSAPAAYKETRHDLNSEYAAYGEVTWNPIAPLFVTLGGRVFAYRSATNAIVQSGLEVRRVDDGVDNRGLAPKVVVRYDLSPSAMVYAQATEGYRGGGVNTSGPASQVFGAVGSGQEPFQRFTGDRLWNDEVGAKLSLFTGRLKLRADVFYDAWRNIQTDQLLPSGLPFTANVGDGVNKGVEIEAVGEPFPGLTLRIDGAYNDPELIARNAAFPALADASLPGVSKGSFGLDANYERPLTREVRGFFNGEAAYVGRSTISFDAQTYGTMGNYWSSKLNAGVIWRNLKLSAFVSNPANAVANTFAYGDPFSIRVVRQTTPLRPRTVGVSLRADF